MKTSLLTLILFLLLAASGTQKQQAQAQASAWARVSPAKCGLSLEMPGEPQLMNFPQPEEVRRSVNYLDLYMYQGNDVVVMISHTSASVHLPPKPLAEGVVKGIVTNAAVSDLNYTTEPSTDTKTPIKGSYKQSGVALEMNGIAMSEQKQAWVVISVYKQGESASQKAAERILSSIKMDGKPCPERK